MSICTGRCSECGRCYDKANRETGVPGKEKMLIFPESFAADTGTEGLGIAFDIGTTTVAGLLWDLWNGKLLSAISEENPQKRYGADVISRILYCSRQDDNLLELRSIIAACMNEIAVKACEAAAVKSERIIRSVVCGNTTMSHIFTGHSPSGLAMAPFNSEYTGTIKLNETESMLNLENCSEVYIVPNIAGHVGGDITCGILASGMLEMGGMNVLVDLGTNGEIVASDGNKAYTCSTAAGPAFEGNEKMRGSELIDTISAMLDDGRIDNSGRLLISEEVSPVSQKNIRDVQLAKGAIRAGIEIMLKQFGKTDADIDRIFLAGAFGNYIDKKSAVRIGLLPETDTDRIFTSGNAAGTGVSMVLVNRREMIKAEKIPELVRHVELAEDMEFQDVFMKSMGF